MRVPDRWRKTRPTDKAAIGLALIAGLCALLWGVTDAADDWLPNAGTEAFAVAITVAIVDRIVHREQADRLRPRLDHTLLMINRNLNSMIDVLARDYAASHRAAYKPLPRELTAILAHWLAGLDDTDAPARPVGDDHEKMFWLSATMFGQALTPYGVIDRDILDPALTVAITMYQHKADYAEAVMLIAETERPTEQRSAAQLHAIAEARITARRTIGDAVDALLRAYTAQAHDSPELTDDQIRRVEAHRDHLMNRALQQA